MTPQSQSAERFPHVARVTRHTALVALSMGLSFALPACATDFDASSEFADVEDAENVATAEQQLITDSTVNLALYRPTSQSSTANGGLPGRAVDGGTNGDWASASVTQTNEESKPWWQVDLGTVQSVGSVVLYNRTDCCGDRLSNFHVLVSDDGINNWRIAAIHPGTTSSQIRLNLHDRLTGGASRGRYVRVQLQGTNALSLAEVQVYAPALVDLAYKRPASQSSTLSSDSAAWRAVDGKTDGYSPNLSMSHTNYEYQPWWKVDLGSPQPIAGVVLWNRTDCCSNRLANFRMMLSNDNTTWTTYNYPGGLMTSATFNLNATARYVAVQLNDWGILSLAEVQVLGASDAPRIRSVDLGGATPGTTKYIERWNESRTLDPLLDVGDRHLKGNFMGLGRDQILHFNRAGGSSPRVQIIDYLGASPGGVTTYLETWGQSNLLNGWVDDDDSQFVGDFRGLGRDQVMYINRGGSGGKIMITDYGSGVVPGTVPYLENWTFSSLLAGWLDNDDRQLVGDFMGLGRSQVMYINRGGSGGKVMVVDYAGAAPGQVRYIESWGQSGLLTGWLDNDDLQFVGDFMGIGHSQVMFINRSGSNGKVMIVDFAGGMPGVVLYWETWGQTYQLSGWIDNGDVQLVGDFAGVGHDQLLVFNTKNEANGKLQVLDYGAGSWPATVRYSQSWTQAGELSDWPTPGDILFAGKFTNSGRADLLAHHIGQSTTFSAMGGSLADCPAGHVKVPSGCAPGCPAGQTLVSDNQCATLVPYAGVDLPKDARVAFRINHRRKSEYFYYNCNMASCFDPFGPSWVNTTVDGEGETYVTANLAQQYPSIFSVEANPSNAWPTAFALRHTDGTYIGLNPYGDRPMHMGSYDDRRRLTYNRNGAAFGLTAIVPHYPTDNNQTVYFSAYASLTTANTGSWFPGEYAQPIEAFLVE